MDSLLLNDPAKQKEFLKLPAGKLIIAYPSAYAPLIKNLPEAVRVHFNKARAHLKIEDKKLTASLSHTQSAKPEFEILRDSITCIPGTIQYAVDAVLIRDYQSQNVVGYTQGTIYPDSFIVISAHYDHLGRMGKIYFPGANDNASGVSLLLELARYYKDNPPSYSIAFIAFGSEEAGLIGSLYYTNHPLFPLNKIRFLVNLDLLGTGEEGITVVNATKFPEEYELIDSINKSNNYLSAVKKRGPAANSDHYFFTQKGVPSFFIYTLGGIKAYHDIYDRKETLPLTKFREVFSLLTDFIKKL